MAAEPSAQAAVEAPPAEKPAPKESSKPSKKARAAAEPQMLSEQPESAPASNAEYAHLESSLTSMTQELHNAMIEIM